MSRREWTDAEIAAMRKAYRAQFLDFKALVKALGRSKSTVSKKATQMGLTWSTRPRGPVKAAP